MLYRQAWAESAESGAAPAADPRLFKCEVFFGDDFTRSDPRTVRRQVNQLRKAWKFIYDVNHTAASDLRRTALEDGIQKYSYGMMFREWERYAAVFTALGMTAGNHARVGLLGSTSAEVIFSFYGLNMVGADVSLVPFYSVLTPEKLWNTIKAEQLTDLIVTDDFAQPKLIADLFCDMSGMMKTMANMGQMNQKAADMMQGARNQMGAQAGTLLPQMQAQMNQMVACMNLMNQTALNMMQMVYAQNLQMMNQFFETAGKQASAAQNQTGEAGAEEVAAQPAPEASDEAAHGENE